MEVNLLVYIVVRAHTHKHTHTNTHTLSHTHMTVKGKGKGKSSTQSQSVEEQERFLLPGDVVEIPLASIPEGKKLRVGPGLKPIAKQSETNTTTKSRGGNESHKDNKDNKDMDETDDDEVVVTVQCTVPGLFMQRNALVWVDSFHKHASPGVGDYVLGIVNGNAGENYTVDIGTPTYAILHSLSFENATKRNRPRLKMGDVVYAKISLLHKFMDPEITCVHASGKGNGMGPLEGGYLFDCPLGLCRSLLSKSCTVLQALGERIPFEITVGRNGRVWVKTDNPQHTIVVANAVAASERLSPLRTREMVKEMFKTVVV
eukprot:m.196268 g.196268  ORF g.196268 m.196268 type:complete len:316 (+) comp13674_c3_seq1:272-1219(+)